MTQDYRLGNRDDADATTRPGDRQYQAPSALDDGRAVPSSEERNRSDALGSVGRRRQAILAVARTTAAAGMTGIRGRRPARLPRRPAGATVCHARRRFAQAPPGRGRTARRRWCTPRIPAGSSLRTGRPFVVEVQQRVDVGDQRRGLPRANAEQHLAARHQQLVAELQRLREIRLGTAYAHPATVQAARERSPASRGLPRPSPCWPSLSCRKS